MKKNRMSALKTGCAVVALAAVVTTTGCWRDVTNGMRLETAKRLAMPSFMIYRTIPADLFSLTAYERVNRPGDTATVYIEGDGLAWVGRQTPSRDPTPVNPVALHLASRDNGPNVIYLARPCQYSALANGNACDPAYWTSKRFAPEVMESFETALDNIKTKYNVTGFNLVGYSGGGAVALMLAGNRDDVLSVRTVAGNLDTDLFSDMHKVSRLSGSLNPVSFASKTARVPQHHFVGAWDNVVTTDLYDSFSRAAGSTSCLRASVIDSATHDEGWVNKWPDLLKSPLDCMAE